jgi:predicted XRE-type DNA-binding protein
MRKEIEYEESPGNVFADLGVKNSEEALAKSELARQIGKIIKKRSLRKNKQQRS